MAAGMIGALLLAMPQSCSHKEESEFRIELSRNEAESTAGSQWVNVTAALIQNDLDYFLENGAAEQITKGGKYGYDYYAHIRKVHAWANGKYTRGGFSAALGGTIGYESFYREGLMRKGLFAGLDDEGREISYQGKVLTSYDSKGKVITSKGKSETAGFMTYAGKLTLAYYLKGGHRFSLNAGYFNDAPTFNDAFVSPRTRNTMMDGLTDQKTISADVNYQWDNNGYSLRVTGFWTKINDQSDVMSVYDDSQQSFSNFALTGIDQRHAGVEFGAKAPLPLSGLTVSAVLSMGEYVYTSNPYMTQTIDNSSEVVFENEEVLYWKDNPVFSHVKDADGNDMIELDANGDPVITGHQKHHVPSTPSVAAALSLNYRTSSYWFFELSGQYFAKSYLDMTPLYRTNTAVAGPDGKVTPAEIESMTAQEEFDPQFLLNASIGKSWYINRKYNFGFSINAQNLLNNKGVRTGGYEQSRLITSSDKSRYYKFDSKYFYMAGANYMLNLYFRF